MLTCPLLPQSLAFLLTWEGGTPAAVAVCCEQKKPGDKEQGEAADAVVPGTNWPLQPGLNVRILFPLACWKEQVAQHGSNLIHNARNEETCNPG